MARTFDITTPSTVGVAALTAAFGAPAYWDARLERFGGGSTVLDVLRVDADGTITVSTTQDLRREFLPGPLTVLVPGTLTVSRGEVWRPHTDGSLRGEVTITAQGVPGSGTGAAVATPTGSGSTLQFNGTVQVGIPLLGRQVEKFICAQIVAEIPRVGGFTDDWIAAHG